MRKLSLLLAFSAFSVAMLLPAFGQAPAATRKIDNEFVQKQFGDQFTLLPEIGARASAIWTATAWKTWPSRRAARIPMLDQGEHKYTVIDPYDEFFGYGNPKVTTTFSEGDPALRGLVVLIIHGAGKDGWRSATPKAKFVIVNLPYRTISIRKMRLEKEEPSKRSTLKKRATWAIALPCSSTARSSATSPWAEICSRTQALSSQLSVKINPIRRNWNGIEGIHRARWTLCGRPQPSSLG